MKRIEHQINGAASAYDELAALQAVIPNAVLHPANVEMIAVERLHEQPCMPTVLVAVQGAAEAVRQPSRTLEALPLREVERRLGVHRSTLAAHVRAGIVRAVTFGNRTRVTVEEIERIKREGLPALPGKAAKSRTRRNPRRTGSDAAAIRALEI